MRLLKKNTLQFERIISLGFFCSVALELEKYGRRDRSYPFDWVISDIHSINNLMKNDFTDLFSEELLYRNSDYPYIIHHKNYTFDFYHEFDSNLSIESQIKSVESKYRRRINNFYTNIKTPTLFIRYLLYDELPFWTEKENELMLQLKKFNKDNSVLLIANRGVTFDHEKLTEGVVALFEVDPNEKDTVSRNFLQDNKHVRDFILTINYPNKVKTKNYYVFFLKKVKTTTIKIFTRLGFLFRQISQNYNNRFSSTG